MGYMASKFLNRFFDYPLKPAPFCVHNHDQASANDEELDEDDETDYEKLSENFNQQLIEKRREIYENGEDNDSLLKIFPEWHEKTISYLHSLFLIFCNEDSKMLSYKSFECILHCLGDETLTKRRKDCFDATDKDGDGYINYLEFLYTIYNFNPRDRSIALKSLCIDVAEKAVLLNNFSVDTQLEHGLL